MSRWQSDYRSRLLVVCLTALVTGCGSLCATTSAEIERIASVLGLEPGMQVADVGAGDGEWAVELAAFVGEAGHIWATEVEAAEVEAIEQRIDRLDLHNMSAILGNQSNTGLPPGCCEAILLRMVYHHFEAPAAMRASLKRAMRPGGRIAVIDIIPQTSWRRLPDVPDRGGHGIDPEDLVAEMTGEGFEVVARYDRWNDDPDRFCIVFRRPTVER